jgi:uncharacterized protein YraI
MTTAADTNLRSAPGTSSEVLELIPRGSVVEVGACSNGWCETTVDGKIGYAVARNLGNAPRRAPGGPVVAEQEVIEEVGPPVYVPAPVYVAGPPVFFGFGFGFHGGWGHRHGWGRR